MNGQREKGDEGQGGERVERGEVVEVGWGVWVDEGRGKGRDALGEEGGEDSSRNQLLPPQDDRLPWELRALPRARPQHAVMARHHLPTARRWQVHRHSVATPQRVNSSLLYWKCHRKNAYSILNVPHTFEYQTTLITFRSF